MDLPTLIIGIAAITAFILSLAQRPELPAPPLVIAPPHTHDASWLFLMAWIVTLTLIASLAAHQ